MSFKAGAQKAELGELGRLREMTYIFPFEEKASQEEHSLQFKAKKILKLLNYCLILEQKFLYDYLRRYRISDFDIFYAVKREIRN